MAVSGAPPNSHPTRATNHRRPSLAAETRSHHFFFFFQPHLFIFPLHGASCYSLYSPLPFLIILVAILHHSTSLSSLPIPVPLSRVFRGCRERKNKIPPPSFPPLLNTHSSPTSPSQCDLELQLIPPTLISRFFPSLNRAHLNG